MGTDEGLTQAGCNKEWRRENHTWSGDGEQWKLGLCVHFIRLGKDYLFDQLLRRFKVNIHRFHIEKEFTPYVSVQVL